MKSKRIRQWLSILMAAALTLGSPVIPIGSDVTAEAAEAVTLTESNDREINFNKDWKFFLDESETLEAEGADFDDSSWKDIQIPHDFSITQEFDTKYELESGFLPGGTGWYRKNVIFPASYNGKSVILNFDGVYNNAYVYVNGKKLGEHHYGYTNFSFDITNEITCDGSTENIIAVKAVSEFPSSRWYSGAGIYRDVTLTVADPVHVSLNGSYVTTPDLENQKDGDVTVNVETTVQNDNSAQVSASVRTTIEDSNGTIVSKDPVEHTLTIPSKGSVDQAQEVIVNKPELWDCDHPNLYYVKTEITVNGKVVDTYTTEFGFRYFDYDPDTGFSLNGKNVKMKGVCMHHDQGALGAAAYRDAVYRQVVKLKEMGCNAIRSSHNAPGKVLLDVCNELGMLVMDEVYDGWHTQKNGNTNDFSKWFNRTLTSDNYLIGGTEGEKWVQFVLESFINRDKNDPCVVMWSIGNELPTVNNDVNPSQEPFVTDFTNNARDMVNWIQAIDRTKPITCGDNSANFSYTGDFRTKIDEILANAGGVVGLNYSPGNYTSNHNLQPTWPLVATETVSSINSRGVYYTTTQTSNPNEHNHQCTAYDTHSVSWGQRARAAWLPVIKNDFISGTFVWTGFDYIGEPTPWHNTGTGSASGDTQAVPNSSYFGIIDTAGFPKDSYYFYTSQWIEDKTTLHIVPGCWNEEDLIVNGGKVQVDLYSNAAKIDLLLNDEVIGTASRNVQTTGAGYEYGMYETTAVDTNKCIANNSANSDDSNNMAAQFFVEYEAGTLSAKAYDKNGNEITDTIGIKTVKTNSDRGTTLKVSPEKTELQADGSSLAYIDVDILDKKGEFASQADNNIRFSLTGNGEIVGVDNGNPSTIHKFQQKTVLTSKKTANIDAFSGKALVIVRSTEKAGGFALKIESNGMKPQTVTINTVGENEGESYLKTYDLQTEYTVDMGTAPVLQTKVSCFMSDNRTLDATVTWDDVTADIYNDPGTHQIKGKLILQTEEIPVIAVIHVNPIIVSIKNCSKATIPNQVPAMPNTVSGILPNGNVYGNYPVTWDKISSDDLSEIGNIVTVNGNATVSNDIILPVKMTIRVTDFTQTEPVNVAREPYRSSLKESCNPPADNLMAIVDGDTSASDNANKRWTNYGSRLNSSSATITFNWNDIQTLSKVDLYYFINGEVKLPKDVTFSANGENVSYTASDADSNNMISYTFEDNPTVSELSITFTPQGNGILCVGLMECEIYNTGITYQQNNSAALETLELNNETIPNFSPNVTDYTVDIDGRSVNAVVRAASDQNPSITIVPIDEENIIRIIVESEDGSATKTYAIQVRSKEDETINEMKPTVDKVFEKADEKIKDELDYTIDSWANFQTALNALKTAWLTGSPDDITAAMNTLNAAMDNLKKKSQVPPPNDDPKPLPTGTYPSDDKTASYQVVTSTATGGSVTFVKPAKKTNTKFVVPDTVIIQGRTYTVTKIAKNAFKNNKKLKTVTIGKNITEIGASAFSGAKKLKTIKIQSTVLSNVGKKAFKGIMDKAKIKVPKSKKKAYKKLLKGRGQKSTVKIS